MPKLSDTELRVLLVVTDQTLGWVEDKATGRRKTEDWISHSQLVDRTGRRSEALSKALKSLIGHHKLIEARNSKGDVLAHAKDRQKNHKAIYYRLTLHRINPGLFD